MTLKKAKEQRASALSTLENLSEQYGGKELTAEEQEKWDKAEETLNAKNDVLDRQGLVENQKRDERVLHNNSGEEKELEKFSFREAMNYLQNPHNLSSDKQGFYAEMNQEGTSQAKSNGITLQGNGLVIPESVFNAVDKSTEGEDLLHDQRGSFIEALVDKMVLSDLGVRYLNNLSGDVKFPKQTKTATFTWEGETATATAKDTEYGQVKLEAKRGFSAVDFSNQLLAQDSMGVEQMIKDDIFNAVGRGVEASAINGGGSNAPQGIMDVASEVSVDGNMYNHAVQLEAEVTGKNVFGDYGYLLDTGLRADAKTETKDAGSGRFVWEDGGTINGYRAGVTNSVDSDKLIFGDFSNLIIGDFSGIEILVNPYSKSLQGVTTYVLNVYMGTAIRNDEAFAYADLSASTGV